MGGVKADRDTDAEDHWVLDLDQWSKGAARWENAAPLPAPRNQFSTVAVEGKIYVIGGQFHHDSQQLDQPRVDIYDPKTDSWSRGPQLPKGPPIPKAELSSAPVRSTWSAATKNPEGGKKQIDSDVLALDRDGAWKLVGKLPMPLSSPAAAILDGKLFVAGGSPNGSSVQGKMWVGDAP